MDSQNAQEATRDTPPWKLQALPQWKSRGQAAESQSPDRASPCREQSWLPAAVVKQSVPHGCFAEPQSEISSMSTLPSPPRCMYTQAMYEIHVISYKQCMYTHAMYGNSLFVTSGAAARDCARLLPPDDVIFILPSHLCLFFTVGRRWVGTIPLAMRRIVARGGARQKFALVLRIPDPSEGPVCACMHMCQGGINIVEMNDDQDLCQHSWLPHPQTYPLFSLLLNVITKT